MGARIARLVGMTMMAGLAYVPAAQAGTHFSIRIGIGAPAPMVVAPAARPGYVWRPGYYVQTEFGREWVPGAWVPAPGYRVNARRVDDDDLYARRGRDRSRYSDRDRDSDRQYWDRNREWDRNRGRSRDQDRDWDRDRDWRR